MKQYLHDYWNIKNKIESATTLTELQICKDLVKRYCDTHCAGVPWVLARRRHAENDLMNDLQFELTKKEELWDD